MAKIIVRPAIKEEFPTIRALIHAVQINPTGLAWQRFLVAVTETGELVGCGQIKPHSDGSRELASIAVQARFRGQGAARAIIEALLIRETHRPLYLMCRAQLGPLYTKFGFRSAAIDEMTPYFQKIYRLVNFFSRRESAEDRLLVMQLD